MTYFPGYCGGCGALLVLMHNGGPRPSIDSIEGGYCHGDVFCSNCLTRTITNDRVCHGCAA